MTVGRVLGDRSVDRFGQRTVVRIGGVVTAAGMGFALALSSTPTALVGYAVAGSAWSPSCPRPCTADELPGPPAATGLTVVGGLLRVGFFVSPLILGL
jgi:hypothetical protein